MYCYQQMEIENVDYPEAIKMLAQKCGVTLKYEGGRGPVAGKEEIYLANEWAVKLFRKLLEKKPEAGEARKYLAGRGVDDASALELAAGESQTLTCPYTDPSDRNKRAAGTSMVTPVSSIIGEGAAPPCGPASGSPGPFSGRDAHS